MGEKLLSGGRRLLRGGRGWVKGGRGWVRRGSVWVAEGLVGSRVGCISGSEWDRHIIPSHTHCNRLTTTGAQPSHKRVGLIHRPPPPLLLQHLYRHL